MIIVKNKEQIAAMREGGKLLSGIIEKLGKMVVPGENTLEIDRVAEKLILSSGGQPAFKGYGGEGNPFPGTICASIDSEVVHAIPRKDRILEEGEILKIDIGMEYKGMITDMARTFPVGKLSTEKERLVKTTKECLDLGIRELIPGRSLVDFGRAVETHAKSHGFSVVRDLVGHGVGVELHEDPVIFNYVSKRDYGQNVILKEGMTLALEPMLNIGTHYIKLAKDGWAWETKDGKPSAQFEDTVVITKDGCEILTR